MAKSAKPSKASSAIRTAKGPRPAVPNRVGGKVKK